jgi:hypothetical protein
MNRNRDFPDLFSPFDCEVPRSGLMSPVSAACTRVLLVFPSWVVSHELIAVSFVMRTSALTVERMSSLVRHGVQVDVTVPDDQPSNREDIRDLSAENTAIMTDE